MPPGAGRGPAAAPPAAQPPPRPPRARVQVPVSVFDQPDDRPAPDGAELGRAGGAAAAGAGREGAPGGPPAPAPKRRGGAAVGSLDSARISSALPSGASSAGGGAQDGDGVRARAARRMRREISSAFRGLGDRAAVARIARGRRPAPQPYPIMPGGTEGAVAGGAGGAAAADGACEPSSDEEAPAADAKTPAAAPADAGKLVADEGRAAGGVSCDTYWDYCRYMGFPMAAFIAAALFVGQAASLGAEYWVISWSAAAPARQADLFWLWGYAALTAAVVVISVVRALAFFESTFHAATRMNLEMSARVLRAPLAFFHTNPAGRVLNRFSKDQGAADDLLPQARRPSRPPRRRWDLFAGGPARGFARPEQACFSKCWLQRSRVVMLFSAVRCLSARGVANKGDGQAAGPGCGQ